MAPGLCFWKMLRIDLDVDQQQVADLNCSRFLEMLPTQAPAETPPGIDLDVDNSRESLAHEFVAALPLRCFQS